jgi:uncharacterized protein (DUF58 family)
LSVAQETCPPELLARIADLELVARIVVEGLVSGLHRSPFHGYSAEFSQYRHYRPGDDLKYVDWKLLARTDRLYTRQFRETTNMAAEIVIDTSASMAFPSFSSEEIAAGSAGVRLTPARTGSIGHRRPGADRQSNVHEVSKFRYAIIVAAALAHVISAQGDAIGLVASERFVAPRAGRPHLRGVLAALSTLAPSGTWKGEEIVRRASERLKRRGLMLVVSDFYDNEDRTFAELRRASRMGHEIVLFQILSRAELELPFDRSLALTDLETGRTLSIDARLARTAYKDAVTAFVERWRSRSAAEGFQYSLIVTDMPPEHALRNFLLRRVS